MKSFLTKNLGLKIASLIFATFMWIIVTNINDPVDYKTFDNVRVQIINTNMLDESGRVYEVLDGTDIIPRVTVRAPRTVIYRINHANIIAKADINEISSFDSIAITLEVDNVSENEINDIYGTIDRLKLNIENKKSQSFYIQAAAEGDVAEGYIYMPEDITIEPNTVTVSGPESIINQIASVKASFNVSNFANDISSTVEVKLYDTEGAVIPTDRLSQSIRNSSIKIPILETKTVPIRYSVLGVPSAGYRLNGVDQITKTDVLIAGSRRIVRGINEVNISNAIDISGSTDTFVKDIDLWDYLINGIRLVEPDDNIVKVTIGIEEESSRVVTLRENQLRVLNMPEGFKSSFTEFVESGPVILVGLQENLDQIRSSNIVGEIDIAKWMADSNISFLTEGFYNIPININLGPNITVANSITVLVNITFVEDD